MASSGYYSGSTGTATVTGAGSTWTNSGGLYVGQSGNGTLTVTNGGAVTAETLYASSSSLLGNGTITTKNAVMDAVSRFDATHGLQQTMAFGTGGSLNLNVDGTGDFGAGYKGVGTLRIADGVAVACSTGYLGYYSGSTGTATVTGIGSKWTISGALNIGNPDSSGTLNIEASGNVSSSFAYLGYNSGSTGRQRLPVRARHGPIAAGSTSGVTEGASLTIEAGGQVSSTNGYVAYITGGGTATVTGANSQWTNSGTLYVGGVNS